MLCYAVGRGEWVGVSDFPENILTKVCGSTLLALRGGGWLFNQEKTIT